MTEDNHRTMAQRAGYEVVFWEQEWRKDERDSGYYVTYAGPDASRRALRDCGPFDNEADAWARAVGMAMEYRDGV